MTNKTFRFGAWLVHPASNSVEQAGEKRQMEPRAMDVLVVLCQAGGAIVSADDLLSRCWGTDVYGDNPVHKTLAQLRRILGDSATAPIYIETIRKRGYRTLAPLDFAAESEPAVPSWLTSSPFRGLQAFDENHAGVFFGRGEATRSLATAVAAQVGAGLALQVVLGPSGSGKTSLVRAGLIPLLGLARAESGLALPDAATFDLAEQGEVSLFTALAGAMLDLQWQDQPVFDGDSAASLGQRLEHDTASVVERLHAALAPVHAQLRAGGGMARKLRFGVFIDRFEGLFDAGRIQDRERLAFLAMIEQLARSGAVLVLIGCRNDFYPQLANYPLLMEGKPNGAHFDLAPPSFADIAQIIRMPAQAAGLIFGIDPLTQARLDDVLCESAAASPDALPLLQYCLQELYRLRTDDGELSFEAFRQLGGVEGALAQRAEQVVAQFSEAQMASLAHVMSLVVVLSANEETVTSRRAPWSALRSEEERQAVGALIDSRLFVSDLMGEVPGFGVAHEAILRRWPRMRGWIETHKGALLVRGRLAQLAERWVSEGRSNDLLLPSGKQLDEAKGLQQGGVLTLNEQETQLIRLSDRRALLRERVRLGVMSVIVLLALLATGLGLSATNARRLAEQRGVEAEGLMGYMLGDFADKLRPLGKLDLLDSVSAKALEYLNRQSQDDAGKVALNQRAKALQVIGEVSRSSGGHKKGLEALETANAILLQQLKKMPGDTDVLKNLGVNAYWMGQINKDSNDWPEAERHWNDYLSYSKQLNRLEPAKVEWWVEESYAHNNLGSLATKLGNTERAAQEFQLSIDLKKKALSSMPNSTLVAADLADSYSWLASCNEALGQLSNAGRLYAEEMQIVLHLRQVAPSDVRWIRLEARALQHRAANRAVQGRVQEALSDYREARLLFSDIASKDSKNRNWQGEIANLEQAELRLQANAGGDQMSKLKSLYTAHALLMALDSRNVSWAAREGLARHRIASALLSEGKIIEAHIEVQAAIDRFEALYSKSSSNISVKMLLVDALLLRSEVESALKKDDVAQKSCSIAYSMIKDQGGSTWNFQVLDPWVRINYCLHHTDVADIAKERLRKIGYRDPDYVRYIVNH